MFFLAGCALGLVLGLVAGGSFKTLAQVQFRWPLVVVAALVIKDAAFITSLATFPLTGLIYVVSLIALLAWTVWHWERLPLIWLVSVGIAMNAMVVVANGGHMTVSVELAKKSAASVQPLVRLGTYGQYTLEGPNTHLNWLGDWIALPGPIHSIFPQVYSPGDLVMFAGMVLMVFLATRPRLLDRFRRPLQIADRHPQRPGV